MISEDEVGCTLTSIAICAHCTSLFSIAALIDVNWYTTIVSCRLFQFDLPSFTVSRDTSITSKNPLCERLVTEDMSFRSTPVQFLFLFSVPQLVV